VNKQKKLSLTLLLQVVLSIVLIIVAYAVTFRGSSAFGLGNGPQGIEAIKTSLAGTAQALLGPFPTQTMPTKTALPTATATPRISATPTFTPSLTFTPIPTRTLLGTATIPERNQHMTQTAFVLSTRTPGQTLVPTQIIYTPTKVPTLVGQTTATRPGPTSTSPPVPTSTRTRRPTPVVVATSTPQPPQATPTDILPTTYP
jgi:hypothetical protein